MHKHREPTVLSLAHGEDGGRQHWLSLWNHTHQVTRLPWLSTHLARLKLS